MTTTSPVLSVIIPCYQAADVLPVQLHALATQMDAPAFELLIIDNRSTDNLRDTVDAYRSALKAAGATDIRLIPAQLEAGASYARNVGAGQASAELLVFCDADDCVSAEWLSDAASLFTEADAFSGSAIPVAASSFGEDVEALRARINPEVASPVQLRPQKALAIPILMGGNFGIRRSLYLQLGGFDQSLPSTGEDNDLAYRLRAAGHPVLDSHSMRIAYRTRDRGRIRRVVARRSASAHVLLCERYGVRRASTLVGRSHLLLSTAKLPAAAVRMAVKPSTRDFSGLGARAAGIQGLWMGLLLYTVLRRMPKPRLGVGIHPGHVEKNPETIADQ